MTHSRVIHIQIEEGYPEEVLDDFETKLSDFVYDQHVETFIASHDHDCDVSDHCYGPGSNAEAKVHDETIEEVVAGVTKVARANVTKKLGHMTWAEVIVLLRSWKIRKEVADAGYVQET